MLKSTDDRDTVEQPSRTTSVKQEWHAPALKDLGDARTVTASGGTVSSDGGGSFPS